MDSELSSNVEQDNNPLKPEVETTNPVELPNEQPEKKSKLPLVALIVGLVVIIAGGIFAYLAITETGPFQKQQDEDQEQISNEHLWTPENYPRVDASTVTHPLAMAFYQDFTGDKDKKYADFGFSQTHQSYLNLINGKKDLILVTSPSEDELKLAAEKNIELEVTPVVKEGFVFFVSSDNPVDNLTSEQVRDIYSGKITNWKDVGGEDKPIVAYQRPINSGSQTGMLDLVMKDTPLMTPPSESWRMSDMNNIVDAVSSYENTNDAIGYSYYYYATTMYQDIDKNIADGIKLLSIDGVKPGETTIQSSEYPFHTAYYIVIDKAATEDSPARKLMDAMLSQRGQTVARNAQYVPVN